MESKIEIIICLGSSCFSRGNKQVVQVIKEYLKKHHLEEAVNFKGNHCFSNCVEGPVVKINNQEYFQVDEEKIVNILNQYFHK